MRHAAVLSFLAVLLSFACGPGAAPESRAVVVDSAGITIVDNGVLDQSLDLLAAPEPILTIGVATGAEEYQLFRVADVKRLADGGFAVANAGTQELRLYDSDGRHRATAGGAGEGPSEFRYPAALTVLPGDTIQVQDILDRVFFTAEGEFVRRETTDRGVLAALWSESGGSSEGGSWVPDGSFLAPVYHWNQSPREPGPLYRPGIMLVRVLRGLTRADTLGEYGGVLQQYMAVGPPGAVRSIVPPFATNTSWAVGASDGAIVVGDNSQPQIERFLPDGSHRIIRWAAEPYRVSADDVEAWKDRQRNADWTQGQLPLLERAWAEMDVPEAKPYFGRVTTGSDGWVWAGPIDDLGETTTLTVFSSDGQYSGTIRVNGRFTPYDSGAGWVVGVARDSTDVEYIQLFELHTIE